MKKDKLYTVTKGNKQPISKGISKNNLFSIGGLKAEAQAYKSANPWDFVDDKGLIDQYINTDAYWDTKGGLFNMTRRNNPFSRGNLQPGGMGASLLGAAGAAVNQGALKLIGGDYETGGIGEGVAAVGNTVGGIVGQFNPVAGAIVQGATGAIGGGINRTFGIATNEENLAKANTAISTGKNYRNTARSFDAFKTGPALASVGRVYKGGLLRKGDGNRKDANIHGEVNDAIAFIDRSDRNTASNIAIDNTNSQLAVLSAYGGPLDILNGDGVGAIGYDLITRDLARKEKQADTANKLSGMASLLFANNSYGKGGCMCGGGKLFSIGGDIQTNGADFTTGLMHINAGGSHEENPYEGVQMGVDPKGTPNLVEEGETLFNDYVFSNRIFADGGTLAKFHLPKKAKMTYADISKKLEKEISERHDDPISINGFNANMEELANQQERQKQEMEAEKAQEAFDSLTPEEQVEVMDYAQEKEQEEAMAEEQAMQEQAMAEQQMAMQGQEGMEMTPEEAMAAEQMAIPTDGNVSADGGNLFALGGDAENSLPELVVTPDDVPTSIRKWLKTQNIESKYFEAIAKAMEKAVKTSSYTSKTVNGKVIKKPLYNSQNFKTALDNIIKGKDNLMSKGSVQFWKGKGITDRNRRHFDYLTKELGMDKELAFELSMPTYSKSDFFVSGNRPSESYTDMAAYNKAVAARNAEYQKLVNGNSKSAASKVKPKLSSTGHLMGHYTNSGKTAYQSKDGHWYPSDEEATKADNRMKTSAQAPANTSGKASSGSYRANDGKRYSTPEEAEAVNERLAKQKYSNRNAVKAKLGNTSTGTSGSNQSAVSNRNKGDIVDYKYDWYRNGNDGITDTPWGFTPDENGLIDTETGYTDDYINLVGTLTADEIREWANAHPNDPSLLSFLAANGKDALKNLTTEQWRKGATDGKYGFMHHVAAQIGKEKLPSDEEMQKDWNLVNGIPSGAKVHHFVEGVDGDELPDDPNSWVNVDKKESRIVRGDNGEIYIYHKPLGDAAGNNGNTFTGTQLGISDTADNSGKFDPVPHYLNEDLRYAGLLGPVVGLGMMAAGIGRPDKRAFDGVLNGFDSTNTRLADYKPIGNYMTYRPMDVWAEQNRLNANARATDRAIANNSSPVGTRMAGLLANAYNNQLASGQLYRQALEYNDAKQKQVEDFNRGTDMFNAQAYNQASATNAGLVNRDRQYRAQLAMQAEAQKAAMDAGWYNNLYGNVAGIFKGIGDLGRENAQHNMIAEMAANGIFGTMSPNTHVGRRGKYIDWVPVSQAAKGGKLRKKKKGLTI